MATREDMTDEQKMLEKPVKGYQLRELTNAMHDMAKRMDAGFEEVKHNTEGLAKISDLAASEKRAKEYTDNKMADMDLKYDPLYKGAKWVLATLAASLVTMFVMLVKDWLRP